MYLDSWMATNFDFPFKQVLHYDDKTTHSIWVEKIVFGSVSDELFTIPTDFELEKTKVEIEAALPLLT